MMGGFAFVASPYSHPDPAIRNGRFRLAVQFVRWAIKQRDWVFSPIVHSHDASLGGHLPSDHQFWRDFNHEMMAQARALYVLHLPDWKSSLGMADEIAEAEQLALPIRHFEPIGDGQFVAVSP